MKNLKQKSIIILVFLLFVFNVLAQDFNMQIISYNPETQKARLQIKNLASTDFHDLKMKIDESAEIPLTSVMRSDSSFSTYFIIPRGKHSITLTTKEGTSLTQDLYFSPNEEQIKQQVKEKVEQQTLEFQKLEQQKESPKKLKYIYVVLALISILIIYWLYKKFN